MTDKSNATKYDTMPDGELKETLDELERGGFAVTTTEHSALMEDVVDAAIVLVNQLRHHDGTPLEWDVLDPLIDAVTVLEEEEADVLAFQVAKKQEATASCSPPSPLPLRPPAARAEARRTARLPERTGRRRLPAANPSRNRSR